MRNAAAFGFASGIVGKGLARTHALGPRCVALGFSETEVQTRVQAGRETSNASLRACSFGCFWMDEKSGTCGNQARGRWPK